MVWEFHEVGLTSAEEKLRTCDVLVATVPKRETHDILKLLSTQLPLEADGLSHLKRVRKVEGDDGQLQIILAPPESACNVTSKSSTQLPSLDAARSKLHELCRDAQVLRVPACAPPDRERLEVWSAIWPVSLRKRPTEPRVLDTCERVRMQSCIQLALHYYGTLAPHVDGLSCPFSGAVLVDPAADTVIAVAGPDTADSAAACGCNGPGSHPLQHASMRLIADLASQDASELSRRAIPIDTLCVPEVTQRDILGGCSPREQPAKRQRQSVAKTAAEPTTTSTTRPEAVCTSSSSVPAQCTAPYIGVGLEVYCAVEPCLMCAMALVHSRVSRVVYHLPLQAGGGLGSAACLQNVKSLNHKLEVWNCHYEEPC